MKPAARKRPAGRKGPPPRRTQRERREASVGRLVDAAIASILEVGYARTSAKEICQRAGISQGGLFRHFPSLLDLIMAAAGEVAHRQIARAESSFAAIAASREPLVAALPVIRDGCRAPVNIVFYELIIAARTDPTLRKAMKTFGARYTAAIQDAVLRSPAASKLPPDLLPVVASSLMHLFDGEALTRDFLSLPGVEDQRMDLLTALARSLASGKTGRSA